MVGCDWEGFVLLVFFLWDVCCLRGVWVIGFVLNFEGLYYLLVWWGLLLGLGFCGCGFVYVYVCGVSFLVFGVDLW